MTERVAHKLNFSRRLSLNMAGLVAVAVPIGVGLVNATPSRAGSQAKDTAVSAPAFEVASIKPNKSGGMMFRIMNTPDGLSATATTQMLIRVAYGVQDFQISGAPNWVNSDKYDIEAKMDKSVADELRKLSEDQRELARGHMIQVLLADRYKLTLHRATKELPVYSLVIAKNGFKLQEAKPGDTYPEGIKGPDGRPAGGGRMMRMGRGQLTGQGLGMADLVHLLSQQLGRTVLDKTGLAGNYDFTLQWTPDESQPAMFRGPEGDKGTGTTPAPESSGPSIFTAIQEQLGLKLEPQKGPVEILVIDHVERPSEN